MLTVICVGTVSAVHGEITLGEFLAFVSYNATLTWPVRSLGKILAEMSKTGVSLERVSYILLAEPEHDPPRALQPPMDRDISFEHVTFGYENQKPVLDDVTFTIPAGSTFAILGGTGSGKTTLMHLLNRLYDLEPGCGRITIGGVDISRIGRGYLRKNVGDCFAGAVSVLPHHPGKYRHHRPGAGPRRHARICAGGGALGLCGRGHRGLCPGL